MTRDELKIGSDTATETTSSQQQESRLPQESQSVIGVQIGMLVYIV
jgi:hypothetical protein